MKPAVCELNDPRPEYFAVRDNCRDGSSVDPLGGLNVEISKGYVSEEVHVVRTIWTHYFKTPKTKKITPAATASWLRAKSRDSWVKKRGVYCNL